MLVLSRKTREQIVIGEGVTITVLEIQGRTVKLGIEAGDDVKILRAELVQPRPGTGEPSSHQYEMIADPTAGLAGARSLQEAPSHPAGAEHSSDGWVDPRPAWLTICCCS